MSRFFSEKYKDLVPYTPGEQPKDTVYIKLNTNESPFPPSTRAQMCAQKALCDLQLYPDPTCAGLNAKIAETIGVEPDEILVTNGSDDILNFAFMAYCDKNTPAVFADITYGFYNVFAKANGIPYEELKLNEDFSINLEEYKNIGKTVFIANPNAPTGIAIPRDELEKVIAANPNNVVVIDEAYVDFGAESCVPLIHKYDNLLVTQTFSKSRSMAGARLGFGVGNKELIRDLNTLKYSTNPYNINRATMAAGIGVLEDEEYTQRNCKTIIENREFTTSELKKLGFVMTDSKTNFVFAKHPDVSGIEIYKKLREKGILVRHFDKPGISDYNRITIGSIEQMTELVTALKQILEEVK